METPKKKKTDYEALNSGLMRIPQMDTATVRCLIDLGVSQIYHLKGRCANALFEDALKKRPTLSKDRLYSLKMAIYFADNEENLDKNLLHPSVWKHEMR